MRIFNHLLQAGIILAPLSLGLIAFKQSSQQTARQVLFPELSAQAAMAVNRPQVNASALQDTNNTGNPQILFDEDFTDGNFDNLGAFSNDPRRPLNWYPFGGNVAFRPAQGRNSFPVSFARRPADGGADWEGVQYLNLQDVNGDGIYSTDEKKKWYVDKKDEVCVVEYTSFSDLGSRPETYGAEVAMLEDVSDAAYQGHPHYGHDLSWEVVQIHSVDRTQPTVQLEPNVENIGNRSNIGVLRAHYNRWPDEQIMEQEYTQTVIWRNRPGTGTTNVEQWGELRHGDMLITSEMNSGRFPNSRYSVFNNVQVALFRAGIRATPPIFVRSGIAARDSAQVGITRCKVGITKKADFDLSYSVGASDVNILTANLGRTDSANIRTGDADNNSKVDANDANSLIGLWTEPFTPFDSVKIAARYNPTNGHIYLTLKNVSYIKINSLNRNLRPAMALLGGLNPDGALVTDTALIAFTAGEWNVTNLDLGAVANTSLVSGELLLRYNYKGSKESEGFEIPFATMVATNQQNSLKGASQLLRFDGQTFTLPSSVSQGYQIMVFTTDGKLLLEKSISKQQASEALLDLSQIRLAQVPKVLYFSNENRKRLYSRVYVSQ